jgi:hypothetical protein
VRTVLKGCKTVLTTRSRDNLPASLDQASISPRSNGGPTYSQAYLNELKASTPTSRPPIPPSDPYDADMSMDVDMSVGDDSTFTVFGTLILLVANRYLTISCR